MQTPNILSQTRNAPSCFLNNFLNLWNFLTKLKLPFHGNSVQLSNQYSHDFVMQILTLSHGNPNYILASVRGSRVLLVMNKMFCTTVLIEETFNVKIMLNMPGINFEIRFHANCIISFRVSHREVARLLIFFMPKYTDNGTNFQNQNSKCTITTLTSLHV